VLMIALHKYLAQATAGPRHPAFPVRVRHVVLRVGR
jgi:hypothetical protein